ncbi:MarR family transcriptional regulator [Listeria floridensis FSL S10-1187]|uniref:MarR family transcriptional regulator n=1 Tax=Listeria floridensis FSL S10-1187 TaxID=1265817 RepID=A0ABN0RIE0_9LIST|nr:MarR family transcriptional regulator [Listeria floridensis]EUJ33655.1 MarR family transcriptional regulator [Listeria floridensis FSL S10-1187]
MQSEELDLGQSVVRAFMHFKRAEMMNFQIDGYTKAEIRFMFTLFHGVRMSDSELGVSVSEIGKRLRVSKPSVTQQINALEGKGLITRIQNPADKRAAYINFTDKGKKLTDQIVEYFRESFLDMQDYLGEEDMRTLIRLLSKLTDYLNSKANYEEGGEAPK